MRALVTGGAGFIGSHIVDLLLEQGHEVSVVDNLVTGRVENLNPGASFYRVDVADPMFRDVVATEAPEVVFHEAAQISVKVSTDDPIYDARVNVLGLLNVLEACASSGVRKVVFASSAATYGNPQYLPIDEAHPQRPESPYGITKMVAEHYLAHYAVQRGLAYTALRYANVYGPRQDYRGEAGVVAVFTRQLLGEETPTIHWDGEQTRDYVYVTDVARANVLAADTGDGQVYCIGSGIGTSVNRLYQLISETVDVSIEPRRMPQRAGDIRDSYLSTERARNELGWRAEVTLREGLANVAAFLARTVRGRAIRSGALARTQRTAEIPPTMVA